MIRFVFKGILRDPSKSVIPVLVVTLGVMLTVLMSGYLNGALSDIIDQNAKLDTGHLKVMTRPYAENKDQIPNDLALLDLQSLTDSLQKNYPNVIWTPRIKFGGVIDVPDENGNTKKQGPGLGIAMALFSASSGESERLNLQNSLVSGSLPQRAREILISDTFAKKLNVHPGDVITYFGTTMEGSMAFQNFILSGTIRFGSPAMDNGTFVIDIQDAQRLLDMEDGAGELLGYFPYEVYDDARAATIANHFNNKYEKNTDEYAPVMVTLRAQNNLDTTLSYSEFMISILVTIFVFAMSVVLWNTGLIAGLRRYKEFGIRLALGESKGGVFRILLLESLIIGSLGSLLGTALGITFTYYLQVVGIDISKYTQNATLIMPSVIRARVTPVLFFIGFVPGLLSMFLGTLLSGRGIYKRATARLFKELEV